MEIMGESPPYFLGHQATYNLVASLTLTSMNFYNPELRTYRGNESDAVGLMIRGSHRAEIAL